MHSDDGHKIDELRGDRPNDDGHRDDLREAAIAAELSTGYRERSESAAWHHVIVRIGRIIVGFLVLFAGLAMMILPGPGLLGIAAGLAILARDFEWAARLLLIVREKANEAKDAATGKTGTVVLIVFALAAAAAGVYWYWLR